MKNIGSKIYKEFLKLYNEIYFYFQNELRF